MEFRRRGGRKEIISARSPSGLPADADLPCRQAGTTPDAGPRRPIVLALARAYKWQQMLDSGEVCSLEELAGRHDVDRSYVSRIINLAALAPDIAHNILAGAEPSGLSLAKLRRDLPLRWDEQRSALCCR